MELNLCYNTIKYILHLEDLFMQILNYKLEAYIPFEKESIEMFLFLCEEVITKITANQDIVFKLKSAVHELLINCLEHGYNKKAGKVSFSIEKNEKSIVLEVCDEGFGMDLPSSNLENTNLDINTLSRRGWGLKIINRLADSIHITNNSPKGTKVSVSISI